MSLLKIMKAYKEMDAAKATEPVVEEESDVIKDQGFYGAHIVDFATNTAIIPKDRIDINVLADSILQSAETLPDNKAYFQA